MPQEKEERRKEFEARLIQLAVSVLHLSKEIRIDPALKPITGQIIRSSSSIGANVQEGKSGSTRRDYTNFLQIALKSANETMYWLTLIVAYKPSTKPQIDRLLKEVSEISRILGASVRTLKSKT